MAVSTSSKLLSKALKFEQEGKEFYLKARERTRHPAARGIFELLAGEETKHAEFLESLHAALSKQGKWPAELTVDLDRDFKALFAEASAKVDKAVKVSTSEIGALELAMDMEAKGRDMYLDLSRKAKAADEKGLYERFSAWEGEHYDFVEQFYNYFRDSGLVMNE